MRVHGYVPTNMNARLVQTLVKQSACFASTKPFQQRSLLLRPFNRITALQSIRSTAEATSNMAVSQACCNLPAVISDYKPLGQLLTVEGMDVYTTGLESSKTALVAIPDIFGLSNQCKQVCDLLAAGTGFRVVLPDLLRKGSWPLTDIPPKDPAAFQKFLKETCSWDNNKENYAAVAAWLKTQGVTNIGTVGCCWGVSIALNASADGTVFASGGPHYSFTTPELLEKVPCPVILLPSKDEAPEDELVAVLKKKPFADKCIVQRFGDMHHGWCAARGDYNDPVQANRAHEAIEMLVKFFKDNAPAA